MFTLIQANPGLICLGLLSLLAASEVLPFVKAIRANGIGQAIWMAGKKLLVKNAKAEIEKIEAEEAQTPPQS